MVVFVAGDKLKRAFSVRGSCDCFCCGRSPEESPVRSFLCVCVFLCAVAGHRRKKFVLGDLVTVYVAGDRLKNLQL